MSESDYLKWRNLIGDFILEFANVEIEVFGIFEDLGNDQEIQKAKVLLFKPRATNAIELIDKQIADQKLSRSAKRAINELVKLADEVRNLIAHNPVQLSLEGIFSGENNHEIRSYRCFEKAITYEELECSFVNLQKWRSQLFDCMYQIRKHKSWVDSQNGIA